MVGTITSWGTAIWTSFTTAMALVFAFIPKLLGFLVILLVGILVARALEKILTLVLRKIGFDRVSNRIGLTRLQQQVGLEMDPAALLGKIVYWFVFLIFLIPAVDALGLTAISNLLGQVIAYIPNVFVAILVLFLGLFIANIVSDIVRGATIGSQNSNVFANIARYAILGFVALIALYQLQIAPAMIQTLFTAIIGAVALAFALAFGLGGREAAQRWLARGENSLLSIPLSRPAQPVYTPAQPSVQAPQPAVQTQGYVTPVPNQVPPQTPVQPQAYTAGEVTQAMPPRNGEPPYQR